MFIDDSFLKKELHLQLLAFDRQTSNGVIACKMAERNQLDAFKQNFLNNCLEISNFTTYCYNFYKKI